MANKTLSTLRSYRDNAMLRMTALNKDLTRIAADAPEYAAAEQLADHAWDDFEAAQDAVTELERGRSNLEHYGARKEVTL